MEKALDLIEQYAKEIEEDTSIDITNVMLKQLSSPNVKHKWLYRLIKSRRKLNELNLLKEGMIKEAVEGDNPVKLSKPLLVAKISKDSKYIEIQEEIKNQELLIEYLDSAVNKIFSQMGFDFKNLVELMKMEQL